MLKPDFPDFRSFRHFKKCGQVFHVHVGSGNWLYFGQITDLSDFFYLLGFTMV